MSIIFFYFIHLGWTWKANSVHPSAHIHRCALRTYEVFPIGSSRSDIRKKKNKPCYTTAIMHWTYTKTIANNSSTNNKNNNQSKLHSFAQHESSFGFCFLCCCSFNFYCSHLERHRLIAAAHFDGQIVATRCGTGLLSILSVHCNHFVSCSRHTEHERWRKITKKKKKNLNEYGSKLLGTLHLRAGPAQQPITNKKNELGLAFLCLLLLFRLHHYYAKINEANKRSKK